MMDHGQQMTCPMPNNTVVEQDGLSANIDLSEHNTLGCPVAISIEHEGCLNGDYLSTLKPSDFFPNSTGQATLLIDEQTVPWPKTSTKLRKIPKTTKQRICGEKVTILFNLTIPIDEATIPAKKSEDRKLLQFGYGDSYGYESTSYSNSGYDHDSYGSNSFGFGGDSYGYDSSGRYSSRSDRYSSGSGGSSWGRYDSYGSSSYTSPSSYYPSSSYYSGSYYPSYSRSSNRYNSYNAYSYSSYRPYYYSSSTSLLGFYPNYYPLGFYYRSGIEQPSIKVALLVPILVWLFN